jgi:hypothetical protein
MTTYTSEELAAAARLNAEAIAALQKDRDEKQALLRRWIDFWSEAISNNEGEALTDLDKEPLRDPGCIVCTHGVTPNSCNTGLCIYHASEKAVLP